VFDLEKKVWCEGPSLPMKWRTHASVFPCMNCMTHRVFLIGGSSGFVSTLSTVYRYEDGNYTAYPNMQISRATHKAIGFGFSTEIHVVGGGNDDAAESSSLEILKYGREWQFGPEMNQKRARMALANWQNDQLWAIGGASKESGKSTEYLDHESTKWTVGPNLGQARVEAAAAVLGNKVIVCGGRNPEDWTQILNTCEVNVVHNATTPSGNWDSSLVPPMKNRRASFTLFPYKGTLIAVGGDDEHEIEQYHPAQKKWILFGNTDKWLNTAKFTYADMPMEQFHNCA